MSAPTITTNKELPRSLVGRSHNTTVPYTALTRRQTTLLPQSNNYNKWTIDILRANKHPITDTEARLHILRERYHTIHNISRTPHPFNTRNIIYVIYNKLNQPNLLYVGRTTNNAIQRAQQEISKAIHTTDQSPLSKSIRRIGKENIRVFALQTVNNWDQSLYYERQWIHRLRTHIPRGNIPAINTNHEHYPLRPIPRRKPPPNRHVHADHDPIRLREKKIDNYHHNITNLRKSIHFWLTYQQLQEKPPPQLETTNLSKLTGMLALLRGFITYIKDRPTDKDYTTIIETQHNQLLLLYPASHITWLTHYISQQINNITTKLRNNPNPKTQPKFKVIVYRGFNHTINRIPLQKIIHNNTKLLPNKKRIDIKLVYRNSDPTSRVVYNFHKAGGELTKNYTATAHTCDCNDARYSTYTRNHHINTGNMEIINEIAGHTHHSELLTNLLKLGPKFVEQGATSNTGILLKINSALDDFIRQDSKYTHKKADEYTPWKAAINNDVTTHLHNNQQLLNNTPTPILRRKEILKLLADIHKKYVFTATDKLTNNYSIMCKHHWLTELHNSTLNNTQKTYITINKTIQQITEKHNKYLKLNHLYNKTTNMPIKYITPKQHKDGIRPICAAPNVTTTRLSKYLTTAISALIDAARTEGAEYKDKYGVRTFFDIENASDVRDRLEELNKTKDEPTTVITGDLTNWYGCIPHFKIEQSLRKCIPHLFDYTKRKYLHIHSNKTYAWSNTHSHRKGTRTFAYQDILKLCVWRLRNQHLTVGDVIVKQTIGIGQGDNHSGHLARLYTIWRERNFQRDLTLTNPAAAIAFSNTMRKHDDYCFLNNPYLTQHLYTKNNKPGLLPHELKINWTNPSNNKTANFLNTTIYITNNHKYKPTSSVYDSLNQKQLRTLAHKYKLSTHGSPGILRTRILQHLQPLAWIKNKLKLWDITTYNKKDDMTFNFTINSYPHYHSNLPPHVKTGVILGQLSSYVTTNYLRRDNFIKNVEKLALTLVQHNLYPPYLIISTTLNFLRKHPPIYNTKKPYMRRITLAALNTILRNVR